MRRQSRLPLLALVLLGTALAGGCASTGGPEPAGTAAIDIQPQHVTEHRGGDDLLTAGLGLDGLRAMTPPAFADAARPTAAELRRRAIWSNWRGIADLSPGGGYGTVYGSVAAVPGREYAALATVPGAEHPHRVLVQVPDAFDQGKRCVVVAPASGSRGVYGAIAVAGPWALPKGCAVAYTDKGAGSDYVDLDAGIGVRLDGTPGRLGEATDLAFAPEVPAGATGVGEEIIRIGGSRTTSHDDTGCRLSSAIPYAASSGCSSPVAAIQVDPGVPVSAATNRWSEAPIASAATAVRSVCWDRPWLRSTSCRASTSASRERTASAYRSTSTWSSCRDRPLRMLKVARRT